MAQKVTYKDIHVRGASTHNLKNVNIDIPLNKITCIYGPSGSGKSSLAFHTLLAESKRRYLNSLPNDVKFFWNMPTAADVESIYPVLPVWGLAQTNPILGSRPNLADTMGLSDYLQRIWFDFGAEVCPHHNEELVEVDWGELFIEYVSKMGTSEEGDVFHFLLDRSSYEEKFGSDAIPVRSFDFETSSIRSFNEEDLYWEVFRIKRKGLGNLKKKLSESNLVAGDTFFTISGTDILEPIKQKQALNCPVCDYQIEKKNLEPTEFSPYSAAGACDKCSGHGMNLEYDRNKVVKYPYLSIPEGAISILESSHFQYLYPYLEKELKKAKISLVKPFEELPQKKLWDILENGKGDFPGLKKCYAYLESKRYKRTVRIFSRRLKTEVLCDVCEGTRINEKVHHISLPILNLNYKEVWKYKADDLLEEIKGHKFTGDLKTRMNPVINLLEIASSLGLGEIPLWKKAKFISSSEYQRALITKILSYQGSGSLFVLDEPSYDLSLEEQSKLQSCLQKVRDQGNTILLVEHSEFLREQSDYYIEMGPGAGPDGGEILKKGVVRKKKREIKTKFKVQKKLNNPITVKPFHFQEKEFGSLKFPQEETTVIWGNSGSYKNYYFYKFLANSLSYVASGEPLDNMIDVRDELIQSKDLTFDNVILFDSSLGKVSSRSTVGTTIGLSPELRKYYANLPVSRNLALEKGHFSPNSELGRCPTCEGKGIKEIEMSFLEDVIIPCDDCDGKKLKPFIANITDGEFAAWEAFNVPMSSIIPKLTLTPKFKKLWAMVELLNLGYLSLGRPLSSLSGGERLRVKLLAQLSKKIEGSLLIFDNISSGLSTPEVEKIFDFVDSLKHDGNTIVVIDQNPTVLERANHTINFS